MKNEPTLEDIERVAARIRCGWRLRMKDLVIMMGFSEKTIRRRIEEGKFPRPDVRVNARVLLWFPKTVAKFISQK